MAMKSIQLRTEIPGPNSKALMKRREAAVPRGPYHATPIFAARAEGAVIEDVDGKKFLDFAGGIGCLNTGHRPAQIESAIRQQLEKYLHLCFSVTPYEGYIAVAEKLNALAPGKFAKKTLLVNSGAEAVEIAVKIARAYTTRAAIIAFKDAFPVRTMMSLSLSTKTVAIEQCGAELDIITSARSLGGGLRLAAVTGRAEIMDAAEVGGLGGTFGGNPAACSAALAAFEIIEKDGLLARSSAIGKKFEERGKKWEKQFQVVGEVRGLGSMCAIELVKNPATREPGASETKKLAQYCYQHGLITITAGTYDNVLRILVPLIGNDAPFSEGLDVLEAGLAHVCAAAPERQFVTSNL